MWNFSLAFAAPDLDATWAAVRDDVARHSSVPVPFGPGDAAALSDGPVASRYDTPTGQWAAGAIYVPVPIESVWIVLNDGPHQPQSRVSLTRLPAPEGLRRVYQVLDLPYPFADRQWVAEVVSNRPLYDATDGAVWQRSFSVGDPALAPDADPDAAWIRESKGAFTAIEAGEGTLLLFSVRTVLGGSIPAAITNAWAVGALRDTLSELAGRSLAVPSHYDAAHERVVAPDGRIL